MSDRLGPVESTIEPAGNYRLVERMVSGGQTGADRAALDWAIEQGISHGGWCPQGRQAEDGPLPERHHLHETPKTDYLQRTEWNVRDSDGTVIISLAASLSGGSLSTARPASPPRPSGLN